MNAPVWLLEALTEAKKPVVSPTVPSVSPAPEGREAQQNQAVPNVPIVPTKNDDPKKIPEGPPMPCCAVTGNAFQYDGAALVTLRAAGLSLEVDTKGQLLVTGDPATIQERQQYIDANRANLIAAILERKEAFEERAAIIEHDGGLSREQAEEGAELVDW